MQAITPKSRSRLRDPHVFTQSRPTAE